MIIIEIYAIFWGILSGRKGDQLNIIEVKWWQSNDAGKIIKKSQKLM